MQASNGLGGVSEFEGAAYSDFLPLGCFRLLFPAQSVMAFLPSSMWLIQPGWHSRLSLHRQTCNQSSFGDSKIDKAAVINRSFCRTFAEMVRLPRWSFDRKFPLLATLDLDNINRASRRNRSGNSWHDGEHQYPITTEWHCSP